MISKKEKQAQLQRAKAKAKEHGGECLSDTYTTAQQNMTWKCSNPKHKPWEAKFTTVIYHGHWCLECAADARLAKAHQVAQERGGKCLSTAYSGAKARMQWKCSKPNHKPWTAIYTAVVNDGHWCAQCYDESRKKRA